MAGYRLALAGMLLTLVACSGSAAPRPASQPTSSAAATSSLTAGATTASSVPLSAACGQAWAYALESTNSEFGVPDMYPAVRACISVAEWTAGFDAYQGANFVGSAIELLGRTCLEPAVANERLCQLVPATPSPATISEACGQAWAYAVALAENSGIAELRPTVRACTTVAEWTTAWYAYNGAAYFGPAAESLDLTCSAPEVANERLCQLARPS
jgi:hypothetical protein